LTGDRIHPLQHAILGAYFSVALTLAGFFTPVHANELRIFTEEVPPLSFERDGQAQGIAVALVSEIQRRLGSTGSIAVVPWARAYHSAISETEVMIFPTVRTAERESLFKWVGPIQKIETKIYARNDDTILITNEEDLKKIKKIGIVRGYYYEPELMMLGLTNIDQSSSHDLMLKKFFAGRISAIVSDNFVIFDWLTSVHKSYSDITPIFKLSEQTLYFAFSRDVPDSIISSWQRALDSIKADGSFAKIYSDHLKDSKAQPAPGS
jgi:polar amino acid transport system substrate-binding protein